MKARDPTLIDIEKANGKKLSWSLVLDTLTVGGIIAIGGMVYFMGGLDNRVGVLEAAEKDGTPRKEARKEFRKLRRRIGGIKAATGVLKERARQGEEQRRRIEGKLDRIIEGLRRKPPGGPR